MMNSDMQTNFSIERDEEKMRDPREKALVATIRYAKRVGHGLPVITELAELLEIEDLLDQALERCTT